MSLRMNLKALIIQNGRTMKSVIQEVNAKNGKETTVQNFSSKLSRGTIRYTEVEEILDLLGYDIVWQKRK